MNSQGLPTYSNSVKNDDPKYQVRVFNGKPQFRIRKRNESAKVPNMVVPTRNPMKTSTKTSLKHPENSEDDGKLEFIATSS